MKIAVIGAGIFGVTSAVELSKKGYDVDLFEKHPNILQAASGINQYRLHKGYHYPRSSETIIASLESEVSFRETYTHAVIDTIDHYYCIAKEGSKVSGEQFLKICDNHGLPYTITSIPHINPESIDVCVKVPELTIDPQKLRVMCKERLVEHKVHLHLNHEVTRDELKKYDFVVICTYASQNKFIDEAHQIHRDYQFELCEKPVIRLPRSFKNTSIVIMDGPFTCVDPYAATDMHVMGHVVHAIHHTNIGKLPEVPRHYIPLLNRGVIYNPPHTNISKFIASASHFMPDIKDAEHVGSKYTFRTVLPYNDKTDTRPTLVEKIDNKTVSVFSGKFSNCVEAAYKVCEHADALT